MARKALVEQIWEKQEEVKQLRRRLEKEEAELRQMKQVLIETLQKKGITTFPAYVGNYKVSVSSYEVESLPSAALRKLHAEYTDVWEKIKQFVKINEITKISIARVE